MLIPYTHNNCNAMRRISTYCKDKFDIDIMPAYTGSKSLKNILCNKL